MSGLNLRVNSEFPFHDGPVIFDGFVRDSQFARALLGGLVGGHQFEDAELLRGEGFEGHKASPFVTLVRF